MRRLLIGIEIGPKIRSPKLGIIGEGGLGCKGGKLARIPYQTTKYSLRY
jgi:hypothetical protein